MEDAKSKPAALEGHSNRPNDSASTALDYAGRRIGRDARDPCEKRLITSFVCAVFGVLVMVATLLSAAKFNTLFAARRGYDPNPAIVIGDDPTLSLLQIVIPVGQWGSPTIIVCGGVLGVLAFRHERSPRRRWAILANVAGAMVVVPAAVVGV